MSVKDFRKHLRTDDRLQEAFADFLRETRARLGLQTQTELSAFVKTRTSAIEGMAFVRLFDRVVSVGSVSAINLDRIALVFGYVSGALLIDAFLRWKATRSSKVSRAAFSLSEDRVRYYLANDLEFTVGESRYRIGEPVISKVDRAASYSAWKLAADGSRLDRVFLKTLEMRLSEGETRLRARVAEAKERLWQEVDIHRGAGDIEGLAKVLDYGTLGLALPDGEFLDVPLMITKWVYGANLVQLMHRPGAALGEVIRLDVDRLIGFIKELVKTVAGLHSATLMHGDLSPSNVMVDEKRDRIVVVDTGESALPKPGGGGRRGSMTEAWDGPPEADASVGRPVDYGHDVRRLGQTVWFMITGGGFPIHKGMTAEQVHDKIWSNFKKDDPYWKSVLQAEPGLPAMLARALHPDPAAQAMQAGDLLETLAVYQRLSRPRLANRPHEGNLSDRIHKLRSQMIEADHKQRDEFKNELREARSILDRLLAQAEKDARTADEILKPLADLLPRLERIDANQHDLGVSIFGRVTQHQVSLLASRATQMLGYGRLLIEGTRDTLVNVVLDLLATLSRGDAFITATVPELWARGNLGIAGRVLEGNELVARREVRIRRVIVISNQNAYTKRMIRAQAEMVARLRAAAIPTTDRDLNSPGVFIGVLDKRKAHESLLLDGHHVAFAQRKSTTVSLSFQLGEKRAIRALSLWDIRSPAFVSHRMAILQDAIDQSTEVGAWLKANGL